MYENKVIIFGAPKAYNVSDEIKRNLEHLGFKVIDVSFPQEFKYKNRLQKIYNFLRKTFLLDTNYKKSLRFAPYRAQFVKEIESLEKKADYSLLIRADSFPISFVKKVVRQAKHNCAYQWDGIDLFPDIKKYKKLFDRFYVFDPTDVNPAKKQLPTTNFYFDYNLKAPSNYDERSVYFLGSYFPHRIEPIKRILHEVKKAEFSPQIFLLSRNRQISADHKNCGAIFLSQPIGFNENLERMNNAGVLVDFVNGRHEGLSFRTFEAIGHDKKLITNNTEIVNYEFYHPDNFFVYKDMNFEGLAEFLNKPYRALPPELKEKYSFTNWIHYILSIAPHQSISLPKKNS